MFKTLLFLGSLFNRSPPAQGFNSLNQKLSKQIDRLFSKIIFFAKGIVYEKKSHKVTYLLFIKLLTNLSAHPGQDTQILQSYFVKKV